MLTCPTCNGQLQFTCLAYGTITDDGAAINNLVVFYEPPQPKLTIYCENDCKLPANVKREAAKFLAPFDSFGRPPGSPIEIWEAVRPPYDPTGHNHSPIPFDGDTEDVYDSPGRQQT